MNRVSAAAMLAFVTTLVAILATELRSSYEDYDVVTVPVSNRVPRKVQDSDGSAAPPAALSYVQWTEMVLARPLFSRDRRPVIQPAPTVPAPAGRPRLAGIVIHGADRIAILVPPGDVKSVVLREGSHVGDGVIQSIQAGQITIMEAGEPRILRPISDPNRSTTVPNLPGALGLASQMTAPPLFSGLPSPSTAGFTR